MLLKSGGHQCSKEMVLKLRGDEGMCYSCPDDPTPMDGQQWGPKCRLPPESRKFEDL